MIERRLVYLHTHTQTHSHLLSTYQRCAHVRLCVCEQSARIVDKEGTLAIGGFLIGDVSDFCCYFYILLLLLRLKGKNK